MRIGQNPAKFVNSVAQPAQITATVVTCIPFMSGFYEQSLDVAKACISSLDMNRDPHFDLMVFDNHSCREVRDYLIDAYEKGIIQYLVLSDTNIGKLGAWNFMFGAAQGKYIAFCDSDVFFRPGWLTASLKLFDAFPNVGMVTGRPTRTLEEYSTNTLAWGQQMGGSVFQEGVLLDWETYHEHADSLGHPIEQAKREYEEGKDYRLTYGGEIAFVGAGHFQFVARKDVLDRIFPVQSEKPMRGETVLDASVNELGYLRLSTAFPFVLHMGNQAPGSIVKTREKSKTTRWIRAIANLRIVRAVLLRIYGLIFRIYFNNVN